MHVSIFMIVSCHNMSELLYLITHLFLCSNKDLQPFTLLEIFFIGAMERKGRKPSKFTRHNPADGGIRIAVVGSRTITNYPLVKMHIKKFIDGLERNNPNDHVYCIVSGGARGVDSLAEEYARENRYVPKIFRPSKNTTNPKDFSKECKIRDRQIVDYCDFLIAIWDGESRGTKYTVDYAEAEEKLLWIYDPNCLDEYQEADEEEEEEDGDPLNLINSVVILKEWQLTPFKGLGTKQ